MKITSVNYPKQEEDTTKIMKFTKHYEQNNPFANHKRLLLPPPELSAREKGTLSFFNELKIILWRNRLGFIRDPMHA